MRHPIWRSRIATIAATVSMLVAGSAMTASAAQQPASVAQPVATTNLCQTQVDHFVDVQPWPGQPVMTALRIGQHPTFDRIVVDLTKFPGVYNLGYVPKLVEDGSGATIPLRGTAFIGVRLAAIAHDQNGHSTVPVPNYTVKWPSLLQVKSIGDFEGQLQIGIGLRSKVDFVASTLTSPNRLVIDVAHPGLHPFTCTSGAVKVFFQNQPNYVRGVQPYVTPVWRRVATPAVAGGALHALFHWPTQYEQATGLRLVNSDASTFDRLSIVNGVARLRLLWECNSHGSTFTVANEIMPTLRQFSTVRAVKVYDPAGNTETPGGTDDSIPTCLEP